MKTGRDVILPSVLLFCLTVAFQPLKASDRLVDTRQATVVQLEGIAPRLPCGAVTLEAPVSSFSKGECNDRASDAGYQPAMRQSWAVSDAPDLATSLAFANSHDPLSIAPVTPVAEASTWFAAALAALFVAWHARRAVFRHRPAFMRRAIFSRDAEISNRGNEGRVVIRSLFNEAVSFLFPRRISKFGLLAPRG